MCGQWWSPQDQKARRPQLSLPEGNWSGGQKHKKIAVLTLPLDSIFSSKKVILNSCLRIQCLHVLWTTLCLGLNPLCEIIDQELVHTQIREF